MPNGPDDRPHRPPVRAETTGNLQVRFYVGWPARGPPRAPPIPAARALSCRSVRAFARVSPTRSAIAAGSVPTEADSQLAKIDDAVEGVPYLECARADLHVPAATAQDDRAVVGTPMHLDPRHPARIKIACRDRRRHARRSHDNPPMNVCNVDRCGGASAARIRSARATAASTSVPQAATLPEAAIASRAWWRAVGSCGAAANARRSFSGSPYAPG